jgi:hypothetical protein
MTEKLFGFKDGLIVVNLHVLKLYLTKKLLVKLYLIPTIGIDNLKNHMILKQVFGILKI